MPYWAFLFLVLALLAGFLGLVGAVGVGMEYTKTMIVMFLVLYVIWLFFGRPRPVV